MTLEERIEKERERNDWLALEIAKRKADSKKEVPITVSAGCEQMVSNMKYLAELRRQKSGSDERLEVLRREEKMSEGNRAGTGLTRHPLDSDPEIAKRRAIVHQDSKLSSQDLCKKFDLEDVPLPDRWEEKFNVQDWRQAYQNKECRRLVHKLISVDKRKAQ